MALIAILEKLWDSFLFWTGQDCYWRVSKFWSQFYSWVLSSYQALKWNSNNEMIWQGGMTHGEWHKTRAFKTPCLLHHCIWSIVLRFLTQLNFQFLILCKGSFYGQNGHCSFILFSIDRNLSEFPYFYWTQVRSLPFLSVSQTITESLSLLRFDWWPTPRFIDTP